MIERVDLSVRNMSQQVRQGTFFILASMAVLAVFLLNEVILRYAFGLSALNIETRHLIPYLVLPMGFLLIVSKRIMIGVLALLAVLQLIWFGTFTYFGNVLGPNIILLGLSQMYEIGLTATGEWQIFVLPVVLVIVLNSLFFVFIQSFKADRFPINMRLGIFLLVLPFLVISIRAFVYSKPFVITPSPYMLSHTGVVQAVSLAARSGLTDAQFSDRGAPGFIVDDQAVPLDKNAEPVTVAVIMGESIAPLELGIYGAQKETTPLMSKRFQGAGKLSFIPKVGFAAGTSTLGSVPLFIRMSFNPVAAFRRSTTIFELAKKQKFSVGFYSAQNIKPLQIAGGLNHIGKVETKDEWQAAFTQKRDAVIFDQMKKSPLNGKHRFYFIHQRTSHSPYICDIPDAIEDRLDVRNKPPAGLYNASKTMAQKTRLKTYKRGLLCYDKSLNDILTRLEQRPGALYVFITADHNEMMGEFGLWGHASLDLQGALVPMILATNRPNGEIAKKFAQLGTPSSFEFMQVVAKALGQDIKLERPSKAFYVNGIVAFGRRGYLEVKKTQQIDQFSTITIMPDNQRSEPKIETMGGLREVLSYLEKYSLSSSAATLN